MTSRRAGGKINALIIALMIVMFLVHEATAFWDVRYAITAREVPPIEQHMHSFLEIIPLTAIVWVAMPLSATTSSLLSLRKCTQIPFDPTVPP